MFGVDSDDDVADEAELEAILARAKASLPGRKASSDDKHRAGLQAGQASASSKAPKR